jgi:hypothetical protein
VACCRFRPARNSLVAEFPRSSTCTSAGKRKSLRSVLTPVPSTSAESSTETLRNDLRAHALVILFERFEPTQGTGSFGQALFQGEEQSFR